MADVKAPKGYTVKDLPAFLRSSAGDAKIVSAPRDGRNIADVDPDNPNAIQVKEPSLFTNSVYSHEATHVYQLNRNPAIVSAMANRYGDGKTGGFDYGGTDGLIEAQKKGKTITDFGPEQQARMVEDYQRQTKEAIAAKDTNKLDKLTRAYHPFIAQLSRLPGKNDPMKMTKADLTPEAPGPPPSSVSGVMQPDKLLGGDASIVLPKGYKLRR